MKHKFKKIVIEGILVSYECEICLNSTRNKDDSTDCIPTKYTILKKTRKAKQVQRFNNNPF